MNDSVLEIAKGAGRRHGVRRPWLTRAIGTATAAVLVVSALLVAPHASSQSNPSLDPRAPLAVPKDYRTRFAFLGAWAVSAGEGKAPIRGSKELHNVYALAETVEAYRKTGRFPDGAVLVKEVLHTRTQPMTTGIVSSASELAGWFVMVKDTQNRYPDSPLWGEGWGWAYYDAAAPTKITTTDYRLDCLGCHVPAKGTDWIYVGGYPVLHRSGPRE